MKVYILILVLKGKRNRNRKKWVKAKGNGVVHHILYTKAAMARALIDPLNLVTYFFQRISSYNHGGAEQF